MTEIVIFKQKELDKNDVTNNLENEILYKKFEKNSILQNYHFSLFFDMTNIHKKDLYITTDIPSILINNIIKYTIPIINNFESKNINIKSFNKFDINKDNLKTKKDNIYSFKTKFNRNIKCLYNNKLRIIPSNNNIDIIGVKLCKNLYKIIDKTIFDYFLTILPNDLLKTGKYNVIYSIHNIYLQILFKKYIFITDNKNIFFKSDSDAIHKINKIYDYIQYINNLYSTNFDLLLNYLKNTYEKINKNISHPKKTLINNEHLKKNTNNLVTNNTLMLFNNFRNIPNFIENNIYNIDFVLYKYDILDDIYKINILGINHQYSLKILDSINNNNNRTTSNIDNDIIKTIKENIKFKKFGNINKLSESQIKVIEKEYENIINIKKNIKKNKEIIDYYKKLENDNINYINSNNISNLKTNTKEIEKVSNISAEYKKQLLLEDSNTLKINKYIQDKNKINIICPHRLSNAYQLSKLTELSNKSYIKIYGDIRNNLINNFSLPMLTDGYFCKICGSKIADSDNDDAIHFISGKRVSFVEENDFIKDMIWKEVSYIVSRYVLFKNKVKIKKIINNITDTLRDKIGEIYINISKNKIMSIESINNLLKLYINIYAIAVLIQMIFNNYGNITFSIRNTSTHVMQKQQESIYMEPEKVNKPIKNKKGGKKDSKQIILKNIINNGLYLILKTKYILISNLDNISKDYIKNNLLSAYKWAVKLSMGTDINVSHDSNDFIINLIKNNKIYKYILYMKEQDIKKLNDNEIKKLRTEILSNDKILSLSIFEKFINNKNNIKIKDVINIQVSDIIDKKNTSTIYNQIIIPKKPKDIDNYKYNSFLLIIKYIKNKLYNLNAVPCDEILKEFYTDFKKISDNEKKSFYYNKFNMIRPLNTLLFKKSDNYNNFYNKEIILEKYFDIKGELHIFDIFVYQNINKKGIISGKKIEYTLSDIKNIYKNVPSKLTLFNAFKNLILVDTKCSICNSYKSSFSLNKNNVIKKKLKENDKINDFYNYYKNICPKKDLHTYNKLNICTKCSIDHSNKNSKFYNKYATIYKISKDKKNKLLNKFIDKLDYKQNNQNRILKDPKDKTENIKKWVYKTENINKITNIFNINYNIWSNLGSSYKYSYEKIINKKCNPINDISGPKDIKLRCYTVKSYIKNIPIIINKIINHTIIKNIPDNLKKILNKINISDLNNKIDINQFNNNFNITYSYYYNTEKFFNLYNYLIDFLSLNIIKFYNLLNENKVNESKNIVLYIINNIIANEKKFSKININNYKITFNKLDNLVDDNIVNDENENIEDENIEDENIEDENIEDDFSRNNIDIEKDDDDDDANLIADF